MLSLIRLLLGSLTALFRRRTSLTAENLALRHQICVLQRDRPPRPFVGNWDRILWAFALWRWAGWKDSLVIVKPETVIAWHRKGLRLFWRWKAQGGRPSIRAEVRRLIRQMATENATWGAGKIHGELAKLGYRVSERTVSRYLQRIRPRPAKPRSQGWRTFLRNEARGIVAVDLLTVPTIRFQILYVFLILSLERRCLVFANVTASPSAVWLGQQVVNAFPWEEAPKFMIRDRDGAYGPDFSMRVEDLGIREIKIVARAPRMNAHCERLVGTLRRELFDHVIVLSESHARRLLAEFRAWYNRDRCHLALDKDAPEHRPVEPPTMGKVVALPRLGGLRHRYTRRAA